MRFAPTSGRGSLQLDIPPFHAFFFSLSCPLTPRALTLCLCLSFPEAWLWTVDHGFIFIQQLQE